MKTYVGYVHDIELPKECSKLLGKWKVSGKLSVDYEENAFYLELYKGPTLIETYKDYSIKDTLKLKYGESTLVQRIMDYRYAGDCRKDDAPSLADIWMARWGEITIQVKE